MPRCPGWVFWDSFFLFLYGKLLFRCPDSLQNQHLLWGSSWQSNQPGHMPRTSFLSFLHGPPSLLLLGWSTNISLVLFSRDGFCDRDLWGLLPHPTPLCLMSTMTARSASAFIKIRGLSLFCWTVYCPMARIMTSPTYEP